MVKGDFVAWSTTNLLMENGPSLRGTSEPPNTDGEVVVTDAGWGIWITPRDRGGARERPTARSLCAFIGMARLAPFAGIGRSD